MKHFRDLEQFINTLAKMAQKDMYEYTTETNVDLTDIVNRLAAVELHLSNISAKVDALESNQPAETQQEQSVETPKDTLVWACISYQDPDNNTTFVNFRYVEGKEDIRSLMQKRYGIDEFEVISVDKHRNRSITWWAQSALATEIDDWYDHE